MSRRRRPFKIEHAVVAEKLGVQVVEVRLGRQRVDIGDNEVAAKGVVIFGKVCASDFEIAVIRAAGPVAEEMITGRLDRTRCLGSDFEGIDWFTRADTEVEEFVLSAAREQVLAHWKVVLQVAGLFANSVVSGRTVRRLLAASRQ